MSITKQGRSTRKPSFNLTQTLPLRYPNAQQNQSFIKPLDNMRHRKESKELPKSPVPFDPLRSTEDLFTPFTGGGHTVNTIDFT
jgi:hypothetical protein